jgi:hypothetical protein
MTVPYKEHQPYCKFCDREVDPTASNVYCMVKGWQKNRGAGEGVYPIKDRDYTGEYAHALCLDINERTGGREKLAFGEQQESLL